LPTPKNNPKRPPKPSSSVNPNFRGFINYDMSDFDKAEVKKHDFTEIDFVSWLAKVNDGGFKVTFQYDDYNHCFICIGAYADKTHPDYGILLSGRGSSPLKAFKQWVYIRDSVIGDDDWSAWLDRGKTIEIDD